MASPGLSWCGQERPSAYDAMLALSDGWQSRAGRSGAGPHADVRRTDLAGAGSCQCHGDARCRDGDGHDVDPGRGTRLTHPPHGRYSPRQSFETPTRSPTIQAVSAIAIGYQGDESASTRRKGSRARGQPATRKPLDEIVFAGSSGRPPSCLTFDSAYGARDVLENPTHLAKANCDKCLGPS